MLSLISIVFTALLSESWWYEVVSTMSSLRPPVIAVTFVWKIAKWSRNSLLSCLLRRSLASVGASLRLLLLFDSVVIERIHVDAVLLDGGLQRRQVVLGLPCRSQLQLVQDLIPRLDYALQRH